LTNAGTQCLYIYINCKVTILLRAPEVLVYSQNCYTQNDQPNVDLFKSAKLDKFWTHEDTKHDYKKK